jgi:peroxiredoxin
MKRALIAIVTLLLLAATAGAQEEPKTPRRPASPVGDPTAHPPHGGTALAVTGEVVVGERAPDFELDGSEGRPVKLSHFRGDWVLLVFSERKESAAELRGDADELAKLGMKVVGVCDEKPGALKSFAERTALPFTLLGDVTGEISAMYGLRDAARSTTLPGFVVLDREGVVRMAVLGQQLPPADIAHLARFAMTEL